MHSSANLQQHEQRINRVLTYVCQNLGKAMTLDELASVACYSKYHFLRIFKAIVRETAAGFVRRMRIEKAAYFLLYNPQASITQIALDCGFSSSQNFAKAFKQYYRLTPQGFRQQGENKPLDSESNPGNIIRKPGNDSEAVLRYRELASGKTLRKMRGDSIAAQITIEEYPHVAVAYLRKQANYVPEAITAGIQELADWARPRKLLDNRTQLLVVYRDHVAVTPKGKRSFDVCIPVRDARLAAPPAHAQVLAGGWYAVYHATIQPHEFYDHWNRFLKIWFPASGLVPDNRPCIERFHHFFNPKRRQGLVVDICVPIQL